MRALTAQQTGMVIRLFLQGFSYDDISEKLGIAKGSITNIIDGLRGGTLALPFELAGYVDELRKVAVDIRKNSTGVSELTSCLVIHNKLKNMGVSNDQIDSWIDMCSGIATEDVANKQFIAASLELARLMSRTGMSYEALIADYTKKSEELKRNHAEIAKCKRQIDELERDLATRQRQNIQSIKSLEEELTKAVQNHNTAKDKMRAELEKHLSKHRLTLKEVDAVVAIRDKKLSERGLREAEVRQLSEKMAATGGLSVLISEQERQKGKLTSELAGLTQRVDETETKLRQKNDEYARVIDALTVRKGEFDKVNNSLAWANAELSKAMETAKKLVYSMSLAKLVLGFLSDPQELSSHDFDRFAQLMMSIRRDRTGRGPNQVTDAQGNVMCKCETPNIFFNLYRDMYKAEPQSARQFLADLILPLVKDRFVPKSVYESLGQTKTVEMMLELARRRTQPVVRPATEGGD